MKSIESSLLHRVLPPEKSNTLVHPTVIFIHGLGADEEDLLGLSGMLDERLLSISVRAPFTLDYGGYTWYDFKEAGQPEPTMFKASCDKLSTFIDDALKNYPIDPTRLFLFGFSMGTVMSLAMALSQPKVYRGVMANSGYLALQTHLEYRWNELNGLDFFVAHGTYDPLVPIQASRIIRERLEKANAHLEYHEYAMAHEIGGESLTAIASWLTKQIDTKTR
jgi:phospholipase/carboxylesterase